MLIDLKDIMDPMPLTPDEIEAEVKREDAYPEQFEPLPAADWEHSTQQGLNNVSQK